MGLIAKEKRSRSELKANKIACRICVKEYRAARKTYRQHIDLTKKLLGYCPCCENYFKWPVKTLRRSTQYINEPDNWLTACKRCHEEDDAYFADLWEQYYGSI